MGTFWQDVKYGARTLRKNPGFTLVAVITLALGIGANTAVFSVVNGVLLRSLPYPDADRVVTVGLANDDGTPGQTNFATFQDWRGRLGSFEEMAAIGYWTPTLIGQGEPLPLVGSSVSAGFFHVLGVKPMLGRDFLPEEDRPGHNRVAILSYGLWQRRFGGDPAIIGKQVNLSGVARTVVGVLPPQFQSLLAHDRRVSEVWRPLGYDATLPWACRTCNHLRAVGRVKAGIPLGQAQRDLSGLMQQLKREYPKDYSTEAAALAPIREGFVGQARRALLVLQGAVGLVLLIACANVANLLLARATQREREIAVRAALGANWWRIARQLLTESLLLSVAGGALGVLLASWGTDSLMAWAPAEVPRLDSVRMDSVVLTFTVLTTVLTGILFGAVPAWNAGRLSGQDALREGGHSTAASARNRLRGMLVITNIAMAVVLLVGTGLLLRSMARLLDVALGFDPARVLTASVSLSARYDDDPKARTFFQQALDRIESLPGVESAAATSQLPLGANVDFYGVRVKDKPLANPADAPPAERYSITPGYLKAMRIPVLRGRGFASYDGPVGQPVALVNETFARRSWPGEDPLGKQIHIGEPARPWRTVVGVVGDVRHRGLSEPVMPQFYLPHSQWTDTSMVFTLRTKGNPVALADSFRKAIWSLDPDLAVADVASMEQVVSLSVEDRRFTLGLVGLFGGAALLLAALGIYGLMAFVVAQRTHEIGIRMALGATPGRVLAMVVKQGMALVLAGTVLGIVSALGLTRLISKLLFGVEATDPVTFAGVSTLLVLVAAVACWVPARRATCVDPMVALRHE